MRRKINDIVKRLHLEVDQLDRILMCAFRDADDVDKMLNQADDVKALAQDIVSRVRLLEVFILAGQKMKYGVENEYGAKNE